MKRRGFCATIGSIGALAGCVSHPLPPNRGTVEVRELVDARTGETVARADETEVRVADRVDLDRGSGLTDIEVTGGDLTSYVTVRRGSDDGDETTRYETGRTTLERTAVGDEIEYQRGIQKRPRMLGVSSIRRSIVVSEKRIRRESSGDGPDVLATLGPNDDVDAAIEEGRRTDADLEWIVVGDHRPNADDDERTRPYEVTLDAFRSAAFDRRSTVSVAISDGELTRFR